MAVTGVDCICIGLLLILLCNYHASGREIHASLPELYAANVAGRISGGLDVLSMGDQRQCEGRNVSTMRYRELDGRCNHYLDFGSTMKPVKRYLRAHYQDNARMDAPRTFSILGGLLPSPRAVSRRVHTDNPRKGPHTMWLMQLGQFIDHDITSAPVPTEHTATIQCCGIPAHQLRPECFPIIIPPGDKVFRDCMEFVRSEPVKDEDGNILYPREQMNALTSFIDASNIYGSDKKNLDQLRMSDGRGALLKTMIIGGRERLPVDTSPTNDMCLVSSSPQSYCQLSGDRRVNEQPGLGSAHLLFHLFHNEVVRSLARGILEKSIRRRNPGLVITSETVETFLATTKIGLQEQIFQEARKIVGAVLQKITYCEWLPLVVGRKLIRKYDLQCDRRNFYNPHKDPRIANGFLSAAFRFGHSLIPNQVNINEVNLDMKNQFMIPDSNLRYFESIINGLQQRDSAMAFDRHVSSAVTNHLFQSSKGPLGALDLVSLNIQRGRDHGIPAYLFWRKYYGLRQKRKFKDLGKGYHKVQELYRHVLDVDLFVGGLMERPVSDGVVGETFGNIIANQFSDLKDGDLFFFSREESLQGFTDRQLASIMRITMRDVVCLCGGINDAQDNVFMQPSYINRPRSCEHRQSLDIGPWLYYFRPVRV